MHRSAGGCSSSPRLRAAFHVRPYASADDRGDGVFEDKLLLGVVFEQHGVLVKGAYLAGELDSADQIDGDGALVLADGVQESVLNVLCRLGFHGADLL